MLSTVIILTVTFDTLALSREDYDLIASCGTLLSVSGLLNLRWEEFSALDAARELGLQNVTWEAVRDETPGSLTCFIACDTLLPELQAHLSQPPVLEYEISRDWHDGSVAYGNG